MKKVLINLIRFYQKYLSPMKSTKCPYTPSCSQYGLEAIQKYGAVKGGMLAVWRAILFPEADMTPFHEEESKPCY